jgi:prolyl-tRNA synthetase
MQWSHTFIPTLKETPKEAEVASHQLMLRAGCIQGLSAGLYIYLPLGLRVLTKVCAIVRETLLEYGAIELQMPALQPKTLWERTGRYETMGPLMMRVTDREEREFILGPTHEEVITDLVAKKINSYQQLPINFYQIQTKFRDEIRPRFGLIRAKEFIMKDGYSFDLTEEGTRKSYRNMFDAYKKIFERCGLPVRAVEADTGSMGDGGMSHEFVALTSIGEDSIVFCESCGYAANQELATRSPKKDNASSEPLKPLESIHTPQVKTVSEVCAFLKVLPQNLIKTLLYKTEDEKIIVVLVRGDSEANPLKLKRVLKCKTLELATPLDIEKATGAPVGFSGPLGLEKYTLVADTALEGIQNAITGANKNDTHLKNVNPGRDFQIQEFADIALVQETDLCFSCKKSLRITRGIEVGHVFFLGTKYSEKLGAKLLDSEGKEVILSMGCYGIGISRMLAAIVELCHDAKGIQWPIPIAPFEVLITPIDFSDSQTQKESLRIYKELKNLNVDVLLDDRLERPGSKFKDAELIGIPIRITVGKKGLDQNRVEIDLRSTDVKQSCPVSEIFTKIQEILKELRSKTHG